MSQNKHQNHQNHQNRHDNRCCQRNRQERIGFGEPAIPAMIQIEQRPAVTIPLDEYEVLIRTAERAEIVARYVAGSKYSPDKEMVLQILGMNEAEEGGEEA